MRKSGFNDLFYKILLPVLLIFLIYIFARNIDIKKDTKKTEIKIIKNSVTIIPKINWIIGWNNQPLKREITRKFATEYDFLNQNIQINLILNHDQNKTQHARDIVHMIENNIYEWDIFWIDETVYYLVSKFLNNDDWGNEYLVNFENVEGFALTQRSELIQNETIRKKTGNIISGPYLDGFYGVLWYNKTVADLLKLEIKNREMNFNDMLKYAQRVYEYDQNNTKKIALFCESKDWFTLSLLFQHMIRSEMDENKIKNVNDTLMDYSIIKKCLDYFESLAQYDPLIETHNVNMWIDAKRSFLNNEALFLTEKTNLYNELIEIDSIDIKKILPAELPSFGYNKGYIGSFQPSFAVFKSAPHRDAAIEMIKAICTQKYATEWSETTKNPTGISVNLKEDYLEDDPYNKFLIYIAKKYQYNVRYSIDASYLFDQEHASLNNLIDYNLRMVLSNQISSNEAYNNIISNLSE